MINYMTHPKQAFFWFFLGDKLFQNPEKKNIFSKKKILKKLKNQYENIYICNSGKKNCAFEDQNSSNRWYFARRRRVNLAYF